MRGYLAYNPDEERRMYRLLDYASGPLDMTLFTHSTENRWITQRALLKRCYIAERTH